MSRIDRIKHDEDVAEHVAAGVRAQRFQHPDRRSTPRATSDDAIRRDRGASRKDRSAE